MTVIATLITHRSIIHASDSLITERQPNGAVLPLNWNATKLVRVESVRGMLAYYGFAGWRKNWTTLSWLRSMARTAPNVPERFAEILAVQLQAELRKLGVHRKRQFGVGIHFSAYERVGDYWVPELFHISNWLDPSYRALRPRGVNCSRDSYATMFPNAGRQSLRSERLAVHRALQEGRFLRFNNGDPLLYNPIASVLHEMVRQVDSRGARKPIGLEGWRALARLPVEVVSVLARDFVRSEHRVIGGRIRDLALTPDGQYSSTSGD